MVNVDVAAQPNLIVVPWLDTDIGAQHRWCVPLGSWTEVGLIELQLL